ncbi:MAG: pantoate--beta-alanine ligase [Myxococcota bacterium]|nr:pantoate--beta-alanine ligase [Myxococcota bacterium]
MQVVHSVTDLQGLADRWRAEGRRIALVPTMGALHAGHLALVDAARERADEVVVSIFVNPAQFESASDLDAYPRTLADDLEACRRRGVSAAFVPDAGELYADGHQTWVEVSEISKPMEGASRPGHFRGVATVVGKLLLAAKPHAALFGEKDFQQLALIRRMVRDLGFDVEVVGVPTDREPDGLARSSRNVHLGPEVRPQASVLHRALCAAESAVASGELRSAALLERVSQEIAKAPAAQLDYAELRDPETLAPAPERLDGETLLALAVNFPRVSGGSVRLIDNRRLLPQREDSP